MERPADGISENKSTSKILFGSAAQALLILLLAVPGFATPLPASPTTEPLGVAENAGTCMDKNESVSCDQSQSRILGEVVLGLLGGVMLLGSGGSHASANSSDPPSDPPSLTTGYVGLLDPPAGYIGSDSTVDPPVVPEPATVMLMVPGLLGLAVLTRKRRISLRGVRTHPQAGP